MYQVRTVSPGKPAESYQIAHTMNRITKRKKFCGSCNDASGFVVGGDEWEARQAR
jgi:hypothetical protein